ncbi:hypothetical protein BO70DRAFT_126994 [Aspergillus heteromorphus CBS 117.55]|uniref:BZIP domain-containing protein n=1 Tax=Aspergillus heteromorphus CBS 117.55 TaxID=1448321 RepID=A0A317VDD8_9EURO|nr:uncharacterized protein BO70DRAFT_126994 [Aspergillus heteromorphus CBS 117.55]PWY71027.1 hypothetical protein BO70DRAFT_126994 [Aspergillus heteromorphus CBS 117.55]
MSLQMATHDSYAAIPDPGVSDLDRLLSASSYPVNRSVVRPVQLDVEQPPLYGGYGEVQVDEAIEEQPIIQIDPSTESDLTIPTRRSSEANASRTMVAPKKRGRPRKSETDLTGERPEERRRAQIRIAQRAYRDRKEAALSRYEARILELETAMKKMNATIFTFGDHLAHSGVIASDSSLRSHLHDTLQTCKTLADGCISPSPEESDTTPPQPPPPPSPHTAITLTPPRPSAPTPPSSSTTPTSPSSHSQPS